MKRLASVFLVLAMFLCPFAHAEDASVSPAPEETRTFDGKVMATMEMEASAEEILYFFQKQLGIPITDFVCYPTATEALMALTSGKVDTVLSLDSSAEYMVQQNDNLITYMDPRLEGFNQISLSMVVTKKNEALCEKLNEAIAHLKENGTLAELTSLMFSGVTLEAPEYTADQGVLRVGVTGDVPPIDYVDASGQPVGFNVNLMTQIGAYLGYEIEFVQTSKGAIMMALATGRIDIIYWQEQSLSEEMLALMGSLSDLIVTTDPYLELTVTAIELKNP